MKPLTDAIIYDKVERRIGIDLYDKIEYGLWKRTQKRLTEISVYGVKNIIRNSIHRKNIHESF